MAARFILEQDYSMQIRAEIIKLFTNATDWYLSADLIRAEQTAIQQIKNRIGRRYDCTQVFSLSTDEEQDSRDMWVVTITIDMALYHLYSKTGMRDIPEHRQNRYQDAIDWLKDVGNGQTPADLPPVTDNAGKDFSEVNIFSRKPENHKW